MARTLLLVVCVCGFAASAADPHKPIRWSEVEPGLSFARVEAMDGGYEAELAVPSTKYVTFGQWETNDSGDISMPGVHFPLPAVVAVVPRQPAK